MNSTSGIIYTEISDHLPIFVCLENMSTKFKSYPKYVKCKINKEEGIKSLSDELKTSNIYETLDLDLQTDPNKNYDLLINHITELKK